MRSSMTIAGIAAAAALFATSAVAQLSKPYLTDPDLRSSSVWWAQANDMDADLPLHSYSSQDWDNNYIPEVFRGLSYQSTSFSYSVWDVDTKNVWFSDCQHANAVSRHRSSSKSWDDIFRILSKVPVGIRQHMSNLLVLPDNALQSGIGGYAPGAATVIPSSQFVLPIIIHEGFHNLDVTAFTSVVSGRYSESTLWSGAYDKDSHVMTSYGRNNQIENFAETGHWAIADITRGLARYTSKRGQVINQLSELRWRLDSVLFPAGWPSGGQCTGKVFSGAIIDKRTNSRLALVEGSRLTGGGDRSLEWAARYPAGSEGVPIIDLPEDFDWTPPQPVPLPAEFFNRTAA